MSYDLRLERTFDAEPEVVFDALLDPQAQCALFADGSVWVTLNPYGGGRRARTFREPTRHSHD